VLGVTPGEYLIRLRMAEAKALLTGSSQSVTRIAELLGYRDIYTFSRQVKARTGRSPTAFRQALSE
jgi:AraC family transcriptional regulator of arabinose operon